MIAAAPEAEPGRRRDDEDLRGEDPLADRRPLIALATFAALGSPPRRATDDDEE